MILESTEKLSYLKTLDMTKTAILIDAENLQRQTTLIKFLFENLSGKAAVQRGYTDFSNENNSYILKMFLNLGIQPKQVVNFGKDDKYLTKNASDIELAVEAMELLLSRPDIENYIVVSGDGGFTSLVVKLQEYKKKTIVVSYNESANKILKNFATHFISFTKETQEKIDKKSLSSLQAQEKNETPESQLLQEIEKLLGELINNRNIEYTDKVYHFLNTDNKLISDVFQENGIAVDPIIEIADQYGFKNIIGHIAVQTSKDKYLCLAQDNNGAIVIINCVTAAQKGWQFKKYYTDGKGYVNANMNKKLKVIQEEDNIPTAHLMHESLASKINQANDNKIDIVKLMREEGVELSSKGKSKDLLEALFYDQAILDQIGSASELVNHLDSFRSDPLPLKQGVVNLLKNANELHSLLEGSKSPEEIYADTIAYYSNKISIKNIKHTFEQISDELEKVI